MVSPSPHSISSLLREAVRLVGGSTEESRQEAEILLCHVMGKERPYLYAHPEEEVDSFTKNRFFQAVEWRAAGCPVAYITGEKEFYGRKFYVDSRVLIPRPETEFLVDAVCGWLDSNSCKPNDAFRALDLGTGSGILAVTLALLFPRLQVWAVDTSEGSLQVARENARRHGVEDRVHLRRGDFKRALQKEAICFEVVVSNPPYLTAREMQELPVDIKNYEPLQSLDGGEDGLDAYHSLSRALPCYMAGSPSVAVLEISPTVVEAVYRLCTHRLRPAAADIMEDYSGRSRVIRMLF